MTDSPAAPTTDAGRRALRDVVAIDHGTDFWTERILAIEAEARATTTPPLDVGWLESQIRAWHDSNEPARFLAERIVERTATPPLDVECGNCKHPRVQHTGRSIWPSRDGRLPGSRLGPVLPRWDGECESLTDWHHTCPCSSFRLTTTDEGAE